MKGTVSIGGVDVPMVANAATEYRYRGIFGSDVLTTFFKVYKDLGENLDISNADPELISQVIDIAGRLGFVMAKAAEGADMGRLSIDDFMEWLEQFESTDILTAAVDVFHFWLNQRKQTVQAKNGKAQRTTGK